MAVSKMKTLINNLVTIFETAITAGDISAVKVFKGLQDAPAQAADSEFPYIMIDDGGERTDATNPDSETQNRIFSIVIEMGTYSLENITAALDVVLDLTEEVKAELEKEVNRQLDGFIWGVEITPFGWEEEGSFFRGRQVIIEWTDLEMTIDKY